MKLDINDLEISFMIQMAKQAALIARKVKNDIGFNTLSKTDQSPVTIADFSIQALIAGNLSEFFPDDGLIGEESSDFLKEEDNKGILQFITSIVKEYLPDATEEKICAWIDWGKDKQYSRYWTLDPIDGTKGYLRNDQFATALALIENGEIKLGMLGCPHLKDGYIEDINSSGTLVIAKLGHGSWMSDLKSAKEFTQLKVSKESDVKQSIMMRSKEKYHTSLSKIDQLIEFLKIASIPIAMDSQAKYATLACGKSDFLVRFLSKKHLDYKEKIWDQAAGAIVLEEAGGKITDLFGQALDFSHGSTLKMNTGIVSTNGSIHESIIHAIENL